MAGPVNPPDGWTVGINPNGGAVSASQWGSGVTSSTTEKIASQTSMLLTGPNIIVNSRMVPVNRYNTPAGSFNYGRANLAGVYLYGTSSSNSVTVQIAFFDTSQTYLTSFNIFTGTPGALNTWLYLTRYVPLFTSVAWAQFTIITGATHSGSLYVGGVDFKPTKPSWLLATTGQTLPTTPAALSWTAMLGGNETGLVGGVAGTTLQLHTAGTYFFTATIYCTTLGGTAPTYTVSVYNNGMSATIYPVWITAATTSFIMQAVDTAISFSGHMVVQNPNNTDGTTLTLLAGASHSGNVVDAQWSGSLVG